ncbi:hypothetical protein OF829_20220 [Sphingomonas sp. LB-2]|uniref:hypothetical protein n=1 Tax=Sphingomonas caeni TaxID=2984949 RepID=UPI002231966D|nr:hypothetical protein [Sphingomonas caeni]MCW3849570.1 hypothetical protein [Sphingomonas caeni]
MKDWDDVVAFACALPEVVMASYYGTMVPKVNGKPFVAPSRALDSFCLYVSKPEKAILLEIAPESFWVTGHFLNYPAVLARYDAPANDLVETHIRRAWWDRLSREQRLAHGARP